MRIMNMNEIQQVGGGFSENVITVIDNGETSYEALNWQGALEIAFYYNLAGHTTQNLR
ncbi:hypothetical protein ACCQ13_10870 [Xanthomonas sp. NCPPB 1638]|uniref:hypothetical protein n=1 Tax=Xanthomonas TaxID=338 RepID=UPI001304A036|nr:hypothetical protein [Xanthomonas cucurbitae]WDM73938.1 hypothetical protein K6982_10690 [Xanthomonas cucurbitae]WDM80772.1 hypothetical protein K6980_09060 [Xanthomonas cucurbitae]WDM84467.1 hypothetical protein K6979_09065 [Xanthomonas cucurbitae]